MEQTSGKWVTWAQTLQALSQAGLTYATDVYDRERYELVRSIAHEMLAAHFGTDHAVIEGLFTTDRGYPTPKIDVRGVVFRDDRILLVRERADGRWSLPGGWCDVNRSPSETVVREIEDEAGFQTHPMRLLGLYDRDKQGYPSIPHHAYKVFIRCEIIGGVARARHETTGVGFFAEDALPALSVERITPRQLSRMFEYLRTPGLATDFD